MGDNQTVRKSNSAKVIKVIEVKTVIGQGTTERPFQNITEYWSLEGALLAVIKDA